MESLAPLRGLSLSSEEQTTHKARWFPSAGFIQCTSSHRREPFCPPSTPLFQASTTGPFCSVAGNNLLLPSCSEVTFCPWLDSTRLYHRIAFELAVAFLCSLIRCQAEQCKALQNFSPAQAACGMAGGREERRCIKQPRRPWYENISFNKLQNKLCFGSGFIFILCNDANCCVFLSKPLATHRRRGAKLLLAWGFHAWLCRQVS